MNFQIRRALSEDAPLIAEILRDLGWFEYLAAEAPAATAGRVGHFLAQCLAGDRQSVYVAEAGPGEILGYAGVHWLPYLFLPGPEGYISELFVRESGRGQGVGSRLLEAIKIEAKTRGCFRLTLINNRRRESYQRGFYKKQGWRELEDSARFVYLLAETPVA
ncbi:MAG: GNAT family N-acetyltransferase [Chloroflexota bacterium]